MNVMQPLDGYGYQDFLVAAAPRDIVFPALARSLKEGSEESEVFDPATYRPPFLFRLFMGVMGMGVSDTRPPQPLRGADPDPEMVGRIEAYMMFSGPEADGPPLRRPAPPAHGAMFQQISDGFDDVRISGITTCPEMTLVEMYELASGISMTGLQLSAELAGTDVLYFRRSGRAAAEKKYDFHVYRDGEIMRRVLCHATWPDGERAAEWWDAISDGSVSPYEPSGLYDGAGEDTLLDNEKIDAILGKLGLDAAAMFGPECRVAPVLFARRAGGAPLPA